MKIFTIILLEVCFLFLGTTAFATPKKEKKSYEESWAPNIAYSSSFGFLFGVGYFRKSLVTPGIDLNANVVLTTVPNGMLASEVRYLTGGQWQHYFNFRISNFYTLYYGEGDDTVESSEREIKNLTFATRVGPEYFFTPFLSTSLFLDFRLRDETDTPAILPEETSAAIGAFIKYNDFNPAVPGLFSQQHRLTMRALPTFSSNQHIDSTFIQAELDLRFYLYFDKNIGFASRAFLGHSFSPPTYLFTYHLGGAEFLRGFKNNRFRNRDMIIFQEEFRFPIYRWISGALFSDIGDVGDGKFEHFKVTYGPGLRVGLPPDNVQHLRLDVGFSYDGVGVVFLFGDTF